MNSSSITAYLHGNQSIVNQHLLRQEICTDRGLVTRAELFVDLPKLSAHGPQTYGLHLGSLRGGEAASTYILVHQTRFADTAISQDDDLSEDW
jgi:hypothetical protein